MNAQTYPEVPQLDQTFSGHSVLGGQSFSEQAPQLVIPGSPSTSPPPMPGSTIAPAPLSAPSPAPLSAPLSAPIVAPPANSFPIVTPQVPQQFAPNGDVIQGEVINPGSAELTETALWWEPQLQQQLLADRRPLPMTLGSAVRMAIEQAPELRVLRADWRLRELEIDVEDAAFDWTQFVNAVWNRDSTPVSTALDGATSRLRSRTSSISAGLRKQLRDGGQFSFQQQIGTRESNSQFINPNHQGNSRLSMEWAHPLLRGGGEDYNSGRKRIAALESDASWDQFRTGVQDHLLNVSSAYWLLVLSRGRYVQTANLLERTHELAAEMERRTNVDVTPTMLARTRAEVASREARMVEAKHDILDSQNALLRLIYGSRYDQFSSAEITTQTIPAVSAESVTAEPQIQVALKARAEIHRSIRDIKIASVRLEIAENEILPMLDFTLTGYVAGLRGSNNIGGSIIDQFSEGEPGVGLGLDYEIPYRNRAAEARQNQARVAICRMRAQLETSIADVTEDVRSQVIQRNKFAEVLTRQQASILGSRELLKYTQARREYLADGNRVADLYLSNLLQLQARLTADEFAFLQSQVRFALADTALLRAIANVDRLAN